MKGLIPKLLVYILIFVSFMKFSAPLPQTGPFDIKGCIKEISWHPVKFIKKIPGASGTLGKDRKVPAHYRITLTDTTVDNRGGMNSHPAYKSGKIIRLTINHEKDDGFLRKRMIIKILDYRVRGDEAGNWYSFRKIQIIRK
jgi:hypothetical protein